MFTVSSGGNLSLSDIKQKQKLGVSVLRSPHIGNFNTATLFLASENIPIILHEHVKGDTKIFRPSYARYRGQEIKISEETDISLTHLNFSNYIPEQINQLFPLYGYKNPAQFHFYSIKKLFPNNIQLVSSFFIEQAEFLIRTLEILAKEFPQLFNRYVDSSGIIYSLSEEKSLHGKQVYVSQDNMQIVVSSKKIAGLTWDYLLKTIEIVEGYGFKEKKPEGIVMKTTLYVLLTTLCEVYKGRSGVDRYDNNYVEVIHFSGVEMMNYMLKNKKQAAQNLYEINAMFQKIKNELPGILPDNINFKLIPTEMIGTLTTNNFRNKSYLDELFILDLQLDKLHKEKDVAKKYNLGKIRSEIEKLNDKNLRGRLEKIRNNIDSLPSGLKIKLTNFGNIKDLPRNKMLGMALNMEIVNQDMYFKTHLIDDRIKEIETKLAKKRSIIKTNYIISQYDMLLDNTKLFFPNQGRNKSQNELRTIWNHASNKAIKETKKKDSLSRLVE